MMKWIKVNGFNLFIVIVFIGIIFMQNSLFEAGKAVGKGYAEGYRLGYEQGCVDKHGSMVLKFREKFPEDLRFQWFWENSFYKRMREEVIDRMDY